MLPLTRIVNIAMAAVICFALLLPAALARHNIALAAFVIAIFAAYAGVNLLLWRRLKQRA